MSLPEVDRRRRSLLGAAVVLASGCKPAGAYDVRASRAPFVMGPRYRSTFSEDFSVADLSRFSEDGRRSTGGAPAWRSRYRHPRKDPINQEKQIYVDPSYAGTGEQALGLNPFQIEDGVFSIIARRLSPAHQKVLYGQAYSSGCITTERSFAQQYGYFEMRARLPVGKGLWPSFWLMPVRDAWPPEIDIFEASGSRPGQLHFAARNPGDKQGAGSDWLDVAPAADGWQTIACEWTDTDIRFIVDGVSLWSVHGHKIHEPMYLLANLALGSHEPNWIPDPDESTPLPAHYQIDYIKVFSRG